MALHAYTGCDSTSAFKGLGKIRPVKTLSRMPKFTEVLARLGDEWQVPADLLDDLDAFTCALYGKPRTKSVNDMRLMMMNDLCAKNEDYLTRSKKVDMSSLPPCKKSLDQHVRRVNFKVGIWKRAHIARPDIPNASNGHGWILVDGHIEPLWYEGPELPNLLSYIACEIEDEKDQASDTDDSEGDIGDLPSGCDSSETDDD